MMSGAFPRLLAAALVLLGVTRAPAFTLFGPLAPWQVAGIDYGWDLVGSVHNIGGPMNLGEEYRWNIPRIYYAFDHSFQDYFGLRGIQEVEKAVQIINDLPAMSQANLDSFPLKSERINFRAAALGLLDLKSSALSSLVQYMGAGDPQQGVYVLRVRWIDATPSTNYYVLKRNFDPVTYEPTSFINGDLWTYTSIADSDVRTLIVKTRVDPLAYGDPVASDFLNAYWSSFWVGSFRTGLTRDDVGALKYIYRPENRNVEAVTNVFGVPGGGGIIVGGGGPIVSPWIPLIGQTNVANTNAPGGPIITPGGGTIVTNAFVDPALRGGRDKLTFTRVNFDSLLGQFIAPFQENFSDPFVTNNQQVAQALGRIVTTPDIVFSAADTFVGAQNWLMVDRTELGGAAVNLGNLNRPIQTGFANPPDGPGVITGPVTIVFNNAGPGFYNGIWPFFLSEVEGVVFPVWGSFDGTTNAPVIYPNNVTIQDLERRVLGGNRP